MNNHPDPHDIWLPLFAQFEKRAKMGEPPWLIATRKKAFARSLQLGFPTPEQEEWRYTRVDPIAGTPFRCMTPSSDPALPPGLEALDTPNIHRLVFTGGCYRPAASSTGELPSSVTLGSLALQLGNLPDWLQPDPSGLADAFTALNLAFLEDGAYIHLPHNTVIEKPVHLAFRMPAVPAPSAVHPHNVIVVGENCHVTLIETYVGPDGCAYLDNAFTELMVGCNSTVRYYRLQLEGVDGYHIGTLKAHLDRASVFDATSISLGGAIARINWDIALNGPRVGCSLNGLSVATGRQHVDNHLRVDHRQPGGTSRELFKGIFDGQSTGIFDGRIVVQPSAQKTDARQTNRNLILSDDATADSKPHLEIRADDVKCSHGATVGQLDEEALFYLRSRGIAETDARNLLTMAFAREVLDRIPVSSLHQMLESTLLERLTAAAAERAPTPRREEPVCPLPQSLPPAREERNHPPGRTASPGFSHPIPFHQSRKQGVRHDHTPRKATR